MPLFSIITINFNNASGLQKTIESVVNQSYVDFEYIVIDGGSTDESNAVIKQFAAKINYWVSEKDNGIYHAMNKGIAVATGKYCLFLNSGDVLADTEVLKKVADTNPTEALVYGDIIFADGNKKQVGIQPEVPAIIHLIRGTIFHPASFILSAQLKKMNGFDESFKIAGDYDFFVRAIIMEKIKCKHVPIVISEFDIYGISNNAAQKSTVQAERNRIQQKYFTTEQLKDAATYSNLINSYRYRIINFIERKTGFKSLTKLFFKINYY